MIKLCYKEYDFKITLGACKYFAEQTGKDLQYTLLKYIDASIVTRDMIDISRIVHFHNLLPFKDASILFYAVIKEECSRVTLAEIQDAMYRVSWLPTESKDGLCEPWPIVMLELATEADSHFKQIAKKKAATEGK